MPVVRIATASDLPMIVRIHQAAFAGFFMTAMGPDFLREYYRLVLDYPGGILLVAEADQREVVGFVSGFVAPAEFYALMKSQRRRMARAALPVLLRSPQLIPRVLANMRRAHGATEPETSGHLTTCGLSSIAVHPQAGGRGIGKQLVNVFREHAVQLGAARVLLTTDALNNESVNKFYQSLGFSLARTFEAPGRRKMNEYYLNLN